VLMSADPSARDADATLTPLHELSLRNAGAARVTAGYFRNWHNAAG